MPAVSAIPSQPEHLAKSAKSLSERMGRIVAVTGSKAVILLDHQEGVFAEPKRRAEIGTLLKVENQIAFTLALISAMSSPMPTTHSGEREMRIVEVEFIGELPKLANGAVGNFRRGISCYPALGETVFRADSKELALTYACDADSAVRVGHILQDATIPAMIKVDEMMGKHFAILGTTGTGKSCAVALILRRVLEKNPQAHILLLDVHREYAQCFRGISEVITPDNMALPFWLLNFDEAVEILVGQQNGRDQDIEVLRELIPLAKARYMGNQRRDKLTGARQRDSVVDNNIGVDTPIPYRTSDLVSVLDEYLGKLDLKGELAPYKRIKAKLEAISRDPRYAFMFGSLTVQDNMAQVLARLFRIPVNGKPIAILELGGLPSEIINVVVSVLARLAFDFGVWSAGKVPITFVCEEAHRYVPNDKNMGFEPTKRAISKIAKEGRKYGVSLCIVTQRPAELDPTILSQCNTVFSMRLTNERDQDILRAGISDAAASLLDFMPTMGAGEAVTFGEGVALPTRIKFDLLPANELPRSNTASFTKNWAKDLPDDRFLHEVVGRWRAQSYNPDSAGYSVDNSGAVEPAGQLAQNAALQPNVRPQAQVAPESAAAVQQQQVRMPSIAPAAGAAPMARPSLRKEPPPLAAQPAAPSNPTAAGDQQSLASLIRQFRS